MTETVVHVTTLEQWKSVLDVWFKQGYSWYSTGQTYNEDYFYDGKRDLWLDQDQDIVTPSFGKRESISYSDFMAQQKEDNKMATVYEVSQSVFDTLQKIKAHEGTSLIASIAVNGYFIKSIEVGKKAILRYLADDPAIEFKVKEQLYRLWAIDKNGDKTYFDNYSLHAPATDDKDKAFTAPLQEIEKWKTPSWEIEEVEE